MKEGKKYYLFGHEASTIYFDGDWETIEQLKDKLNGVESRFFEFDPDTMSVSNLLAVYDGWDGYVELSEGEYKALVKTDVYSITLVRTYTTSIKVLAKSEVDAIRQMEEMLRNGYAHQMEMEQMNVDQDYTIVKT